MQIAKTNRRRTQASYGEEPVATRLGLGLADYYITKPFTSTQLVKGLVM